MAKVHRVKDKDNVIKRFRIIPYEELVEILTKDDEAFLEGPFKRQTVWRAARKLSGMVGKKVVAERAFLKIEKRGITVEGYNFSLAEEQTDK